MNPTIRPALWDANDLEEVRCDCCGQRQEREIFTHPDGMRVVECCGGRSKTGPKVAVYFYPVSVCNGPFAQGVVQWPDRA